VIDSVVKFRRTDQLHGGLTTIGAEAAGNIRDIDSCQRADDRASEFLHLPFEQGKMSDLVWFSIPDDDLGTAQQDRLHKFRDIGSAVLIVTVGVDDDIGSQSQTSIDPGGKSVAKPTISRKAQDMFDAHFPSDFHCSISAAVINHQDFDGIDPDNLTRNVPQCCRKCVLFVETRDLHDELHGVIFGSATNEMQGESRWGAKCLQNMTDSV